MEDILDYFLKSVKKLDNSSVDFLHSGNLSIHDIAADSVYIKPSGLSYNELTKENISKVKLNGLHLQGLKPSSDLEIHLGIYKARKDIKAIVHTHSHYATVLAIAEKNLPVLCSMHADYFGNEIKCLPYLSHRSNDISKQIINSGAQNVCLLGKHGVFTFADNLEKAIEYAIVLEEIAKLYVHAWQINPNIDSIDSKYVKELHSYYNYSYGN